MDSKPNLQVQLGFSASLIKYFPFFIFREAFPEGEYPPLDELKRNVSLVLLNEHFTQSVPRPYVPNMIEVGGLQIKDKPSPLPEVIFCCSIILIGFILGFFILNIVQTSYLWVEILKGEFLMI